MLINIRKDNIICNESKTHVVYQTFFSDCCRPFSGLNHLKTHQIFEVLGLSEEKVNEFVTKNVPEEKRDNVQAVLSLNPTLRSVCSITFYASQLCKVLQDETDAVKLNISTYSQITAFIILVSSTCNSQAMQ